MTQPFRTIGIDDLRDAVWQLFELDATDAELAARGIELGEHGVMREGLGPSRFTVLELQSGLQVILERLDLSPDTIAVVPTVTEPAPALKRQLLDVLGLPPERIVWSESDEFWDHACGSYDRDAWLARPTRRSGSS